MPSMRLARAVAAAAAVALAADAVPSAAPAPAAVAAPEDGASLGACASEGAEACSLLQAQRVGPPRSYCDQGRLEDAKIDGDLVAFDDCVMINVRVLGQLKGHGRLVVHGGFVGKGIEAGDKAGPVILDKGVRVAGQVRMQAGSGDLNISGSSHIGDVSMVSAGALRIEKAVVDSVKGMDTTSVSITDSVVKTDVSLKNAQGSVELSDARLGTLSLEGAHAQVKVRDSILTTGLQVSKSSGSLTVSASRPQELAIGPFWGPVALTGLKVVNASLDGVTGSLSIDHVDFFADSTVAKSGDLAMSHCTFHSAAGLNVSETLSVFINSTNFTAGALLNAEKVDGDVALRGVVGATVRAEECYDVRIFSSDLQETVVDGVLGFVVVEDTAITHLRCSNITQSPSIGRGSRVSKSSGCSVWK